MIIQALDRPPASRLGSIAWSAVSSCDACNACIGPGWQICTLQLSGMHHSSWTSCFIKIAVVGGGARA